MARDVTGTKQAGERAASSSVVLQPAGRKDFRMKLSDVSKERSVDTKQVASRGITKLDPDNVTFYVFSLLVLVRTGVDGT